jgi:hypothetical protein
VVLGRHQGAQLHGGAPSLRARFHLEPHGGDVCRRWRTRVEGENLQGAHGIRLLHGGEARSVLQVPQALSSPSHAWSFILSPLHVHVRFCACPACLCCYLLTPILRRSFIVIYLRTDPELLALLSLNSVRTVVIMPSASIEIDEVEANLADISITESSATELLGYEGEEFVDDAIATETTEEVDFDALDEL